MLPRNLLPEGYTAFIAGGYAACPALASDMDVWVRAQTEDLAAKREALIAHLEARYGVAFEEEEETRTEASYELGTCTIFKVGKIDLLHIHVLLTDGSVEDTLNGFDVSTHQIALTTQGVVRGEEWTPITVPPVKLRESPTTDARMKKIAERYGHAS